MEKNCPNSNLRLDTAGKIGGSNDTLINCRLHTRHSQKGKRERGEGPVYETYVMFLLVTIL